MLVLSRKIGERIVVAGNVEITISQIRGSRVRLAVNAPRHVSIARFEKRTGDRKSNHATPVVLAHPVLDVPDLSR